MHRRDLEALAARLAHDLVVHANQVVTQLRELGTVALVGTRRNAVLLRASDPAHAVFVRAAATRATQPLVSVFVLVKEEGALV
jgi:hypothetical protein